MDRLERLQSQVRKIMKNDPAHDYDHIMRVYANARRLCKKEKIKPDLVLAAALLHDIASYAKSDRRSKNSSLNSAKKAQGMLPKYGYSQADIAIICGAIRDHSFSRGVTPKTAEGKILQDADRLDAMGAVGIARVFSVSGSEQRSFYSRTDPFCKERSPDDKKYALDHFYKKLFKLESLMNTKSAKTEAKKRSNVLQTFIADLEDEISVKP